VVTDENYNPIDYRVLEVNRAYEKLTEDERNQAHLRP